MNKESEFFFITESQWLAFAEELAGGHVICKDGVAMYDSLIVEKRTNAIALSALCMHMCIMVKAENVWIEFIKE